MATITGTVGKRKSFAGGANIFECKLQQINRQGVQLIAEGFNIEDVTVTVVFPGGAEQQPTELETTNNTVCIVGRHFSMDAIKISGVPAGENYITIIQL